MPRGWIGRLKTLVGPGGVDASDEARAAHGYDAARIRGLPDVVVHPSDTSQVAAVLAFCHEEGIPVHPRGAGSGMAGGSVPLQGGVALVLTRMNRVLAVHRDDLYAEVEPGVVTGDFQKRVEALGLFYPPDPGSLAFCTLGGNAATGAGGPRGLKYGVTRDYVLGLEAVAADGSVLRTGVRTLKGVVGYDLTRLLVGSEGTLAVITGIRLKLLPRPAAVRTALVLFGRADEAARAVQEIVAAGILPSTLEYMDRACLRAAERLLTGGGDPGGAAALLVETDGSGAEAAAQMHTVREVCARLGSLEFREAGDPAGRERLWRGRRSLSQAVHRPGHVKVNEDVAVPRSRLAELLEFLDGLARRRGIPVLCFGHAGDGNLHVNLLVPEERMEEAPEMVEALFAEVVRLQGTLSAEHGVGAAKAPYVTMEVPPACLEAMRRIKRALDPRGILNPGKIFPPEATRTGP